MTSNNTLRFYLQAGKATPNTYLSSILGQRGLNIINFCNHFNNLTNKTQIKLPLRIIIHYKDKKIISTTIKSPSLTTIIKKILSLDKLTINSSLINKHLTSQVLLRIVKLKINDFNTYNFKKCISMVLSTIRSYNINNES